MIIAPFFLLDVHDKIVEYLASGNPISDGRLLKSTRRIAPNISPIFFRAGDEVTGDTSTIIAFSTR